MNRLFKKINIIKNTLEIKFIILKVRFRVFIRPFIYFNRGIRRTRNSHLGSGSHRNVYERTISVLFRTLKIGSICFLIILYISFFPSPHSFFSNEKPYFGDFSWSSINQVRLSAGDFHENARGGLEHYVPKLRLIDYTIDKGDTLWSISRKFDVDPDSIISSNIFSNVHNIHEGETILIPNIRGIFVNVNEGDTIFKYSTKYEIPPDFIMEVNDLKSNMLVPGMKIFLPGVRYNNMERAYALGEAFDKPVRGRLTSRFGYRRDPFSGKRSYHTGIDIANRYGAAVHSAQEGKIIYIGIKPGYGKIVIIQHSFGYRTVYAHLSTVRVSRGLRIKKGDIIGFIGTSGRTTGPHLHFEIWLNNRLINPLTQTNMTVR